MQERVGCPTGGNSGTDAKDFYDSVGKLLRPSA
jgi:hypothetical protein